MGLFSEGFGSGLATGLAESVDQSLKTALDKREKELSRARTFWETRQAQKMDLADTHDERAKAALDKLINEFGGNIAKGRAAYEAVGGNVDDVESYLASVKDTRDKLGEYNIADKLKLDGIDMSQFGDMSYETAYSSVRKEVDPLDISYTYRGQMANLLPGSQDLGYAISSDINELMPARQYEDIKEFALAEMDRSGLAVTEEYAAEMAKNMLAGLPKLDYNTGLLMSGKLSPEEEDKLREENAAIILNQRLLAEAKDTSGGDFTTLTELTSQFKNWRTEQENKIGYVAGKPGQAAIAYPIMPDGSRGEQVTGADAVAYRNKYIGEKQVDWVRNNLLDDKGQARNVDAQAMITGHDFRTIVKGIQKDIASTAEAEEGAETPTVEGSIVDPNYDPESEDNEAAQAEAAASVVEKPLADQTPEEAGFATKADVQANPQGFVDYIVALNQAAGEEISIETLYIELQEKYNIPIDQIEQILGALRDSRAEAERAAAEAAAAREAFLNPPTPQRKSQPIVDVEEGDFGSGA